MYELSRTTCSPVLEASLLPRPMTLCSDPAISEKGRLVLRGPETLVAQAFKPQIQLKSKVLHLLQE